ncbi:MAG: Carboxylesterase family-domain-containing protein [Linnemannia elongata]|nr:MAG: Carboxylesterase family-domain-containing protein [Linnemannia elongata]
MVPPIITKALLVASCLAAAASASPLYRRQFSQESSLVQDAPFASDLAGVHLLLNNDLDSNTPKHPVIFLAEARSYKDSKHVCDRLGEDLVDSGNLGFAKDLLDITPIAASDLKKVSRLWVKNADTSSSSCTAFDRKSGHTVQLPCSTHLPALCANTLPRYQIGLDVHTDKSKQIKVRTPHAGTYQGYRDQNQFRFLGIKYAQPPVGRLRFLPPQQMKAGDANKAKDATKYGFVCMQGAYEGDSKPNATEEFFSLGAAENEDCLHLNVFTPSFSSGQDGGGKKKGLPVMVYVHGGSFTSFAGSSPVFEPGNLVSRGGVVVVTLNYRLGIFGFFENPPLIPRSKATGNLAIRDQMMALQWVQDNIVAFGGDPDQVTIFGESAGGYSMRALLSIPAAFGLYRNAISQSDLLGIPFSSPKVAGQIGAGLLKYLGCSPSDLACAQSKTAIQVRNAESNATMDVVKADGNEWLLTAGGVYRPTIDGDFLPGDFAELVRTGRYNRKANILWGSTRDEAAAFLPYVFPDPIPLDEEDKALAGYLLEDRTKKLFTSPAYALNKSDNDTIRNELSIAVTDLLWACGVQRMSRGTAYQHSKVYTYRMDHGRDIYSTFDQPYPSFCHGRVCHADDVIPSFGSGDVKDGTAQTGSDARFSRQVIDRFATFAKTGTPNPKKKDSEVLGLAGRNADVTGVTWPEYVSGEDRVFVFEEETGRVEVGKDTERCQWIEKNVHYDYQVHAPNGKFVPIFP